MNTEELRALVDAKVQLAETGDLYALLGISPTATSDDVKVAYFGLAKAVHPDRIARREDVEEDLANAAGIVFRAVTQAYNTLTDGDARAVYDGKHVDDEDGAVAEPVEQEGPKLTEEDARIFAHRGELMLRRGDCGPAEEFFRKALHVKPDDVALLVKLGRAVFHNEDYPPARRMEDARDLWEKALKVDEENAEAHYYIALYWKEKGDFGRMEGALKKAIKHKPRYIEAERELRLSKMRRKRNGGNSSSSDEEGGSFMDKLKGLFSKKA